MPRKTNAAEALVQLDRALKILKDDDFKIVAYMLKMAKLELLTIANNIRQHELEQLVCLASTATASRALVADNEDGPKRWRSEHDPEKSQTFRTRSCDKAKRNIKST